jgi:hypothetical protein
VEVIPGKLKVKIFAHEIQFEKEVLPCWSFVTDGLAAQHQKEIIFTLRREKNQKVADYPREFLGLFATIFHLAEEGKIVDAGDTSFFGDSGFLGDKEFRGIGYVEPDGFPGVDTGGVPLLAGILLKGDEGPIAQDLALTRVTALLGLKYHYYPCPTWSDLKRETVASLNGMEFEEEEEDEDDESDEEDEDAESDDDNEGEDDDEDESVRVARAPSPASPPSNPAHVTKAASLPSQRPPSPSFKRPPGADKNAIVVDFDGNSLARHLLEVFDFEPRPPK